MKIIPLKELSGVTTAEIIKSAMQPAPVAMGQLGGLDFDGQFARARILKALRLNADDTQRLLLEDEDYKTLLTAVMAVRWTSCTEEIAEILGDIRDAKDASVIEKQADPPPPEQPTA